MADDGRCDAGDDVTDIGGTLLKADTPSFWTHRTLRRREGANLIIVLMLVCDGVLFGDDVLHFF